MLKQGYSIKNWRQSRVRSLGKVWWQESTVESNIELVDLKKEKQFHDINPNQVYKRLSSPVVPGLSFVSTTSGIYRSFDGEKWSPVGDFEYGYPIWVAQNGALFVADQISFDHGESFQNFVRWDLVFNSIPNHESHHGDTIRILNIETEPGSYERITLRLKIGKRRPIEIYTANMGQSWRLK